ncbi:MAG: hypothetical protein CM1200mP30_27410 [Pseudomonadota bacterium]|nr:MAG: hypothetical protein CM1200mP30_27410 [Pseudomonadota bacterium]
MQFFIIIINAEKEKQWPKILVHVTNGPENPTRAALAFLVAKSGLMKVTAFQCFLQEMPFS